MNAVNYANPSALEPLQVKQMEASSAIRWIYPELFQRIGTADVMLPFYFSEDQFDKGGTASKPTIAFNGDAAYSTPVIRAGVRLAYADDFFGMSAKDVLLCYDRLVRVPGQQKAAFGGYTYKYSQDSEGIPVMMASAANAITAKVVHSTPRMLGWFMPAFAGECSVVLGGESGEEVTGFGFLNDSDTDETTIANRGPSFRAIAYRGQDTQSDANSIMTLGSAAVNVSRAQAFTQIWNMKRASSLNPGSSAFDVSISLADGFSQAATPTLRELALFMFQ